MSTVWEILVNECQGIFVKPVDIKLPSRQYDMGRLVGSNQTTDDTDSDE